MLGHQSSALADEQCMQSIHLAILLGLSEAQRDIFRWRCRERAACRHQSYSQNSQQMPAVKDGHALLPRGTKRGLQIGVAEKH